MVFPILYPGERKTGYFKLKWYLFEWELYNLEKTKKTSNYALQQRKMLDKIVKKNIPNNKVVLIVKMWSWQKITWWISDIYRIEILDNDWNIIDSINIHKEGVPLEIREEFDKQFRT